jgi:hypothetical protein
MADVKRQDFRGKAKKYLEAIREGQTTAEALETAGMAQQHYWDLRSDLHFVAHEMSARTKTVITAEEVIPLQERLQKEWYLEALKDNAGNRSTARKAAGLSREAYGRYCEDGAFREAEIDVIESIIDGMEEQAVRVATGDNPKVRDTQHLRWMLEKLKKDRYGPVPKVIDHRYSGNVTIASVDDEIQQLLRGADITDAVLVEK